MENFANLFSDMNFLEDTVSICITKVNESKKVDDIKIMIEAIASY